MSKRVNVPYLTNKAFDIDGKPELAEAIACRLEWLGVSISGSRGRGDAKHIYTSHFTGPYPAITFFASHTDVQSAVRAGFKLSTLSDLYDIPVVKHTISIDGGKAVELSDKSYKNLNEAMK